MRGATHSGCSSFFCVSQAWNESSYPTPLCMHYMEPCNMSRVMSIYSYDLCVVLNSVIACQCLLNGKVKSANKREQRKLIYSAEREQARRSQNRKSGNCVHAFYCCFITPRLEALHFFCSFEISLWDWFHTPMCAFHTSACRLFLHKDKIS